ncbi:hypothetical protein [Alkalibacterium sp. 20]|uniref:hypothetical protein n=1 Tax=Alkalibacterium sp. 20 TaxID=1798803 RepID=UPI000910256F|nr:hypothetical protein [Alkalibacterium sp. 20]OJF91157.1 hypothetical protein AX762_11225 [Alkalibacterium sp. 20]
MKTSRKTNLEERIQIAIECMESGNDVSEVRAKSTSLSTRGLLGSAQLSDTPPNHYELAH